MKAGALLAESYPVDADIVIGVPDSGLDAALGYAYAAKIPYGIGLIKNKIYWTDVYFTGARRSAGQSKDQVESGKKCQLMEKSDIDR